VDPETDQLNPTPEPSLNMKAHPFLSRCGYIAALTASTFLTGCASTSSNSAGITAADGGELPKKADLLFVQNARSVGFAKNRMTLHGVNPTTIAFADRPVRFAGHMPTSHFVPMWSQGKDSFLKDPPNATLSVMGSGKVSSVVVVLRNPHYAGGDLSYDVQVLEGTPPAHGGAASLFIDVIGMPRTPVSYAGAARRTVRTPYVGAHPAYIGGATAVHYGCTTVVGGPVYGPTVVHHSTTVVRRW
jgi:hypothetical protein